jgi:hypothetical protein
MVHIELPARPQAAEHFCSEEKEVDPVEDNVGPHPAASMRERVVIASSHSDLHEGLEL